MAHASQSPSPCGSSLLNGLAQPDAADPRKFLRNLAEMTQSLHGASKRGAFITPLERYNGSMRRLTSEDFQTGHPNDCRSISRCMPALEGSSRSIIRITIVPYWGVRIVQPTPHHPLSKLLTSAAAGDASSLRRHFAAHSSQTQSVRADGHRLSELPRRSYWFSLLSASIRFSRSTRCMA